MEDEIKKIKDELSAITQRLMALEKDGKMIPELRQHFLTAFLGVVQGRTYLSFCIDYFKRNEETEG